MNLHICYILCLFERYDARFQLILKPMKKREHPWIDWFI